MKSTVLIGCLLFFLYGCDLFNTREAESPNQPRSNYQPAFTPSILIENLKNSLKDKDVKNYLACLSDSLTNGKDFNFLASGAAVSQYPSLSDNWNKADEQLYFNNLKTKIPENLPVLLILSDTLLSRQANLAVYTAEYSLQVPSNETDIPSLYEGSLRFNLVNDERNIWTIYTWEDTKNDESPSWSELKGRLR